MDSTTNNLVHAIHVSKAPSPDISIRWSLLTLEDIRWQSKQCLYAYLAPKGNEILYIGKSWGVTVRGRWERDAKAGFWEDLEQIRKIRNHRAVVGQVSMNYSGRLTGQLLADVESLLIMAEQSWGNIQSRQSRIPRPGLIVECLGSWVGQARYYKDNA